jgi:ribosomal protein S18 acetylase RimI-like enzyme
MSAALPEGFHDRAGTLDDIPRLAALESAFGRAHQRTMRTEQELRTEWRTPGFAPDADTRVVIDAGNRIVGWCEVYDSAPHVRVGSAMRIAPEGIPEAVPAFLLAWCLRRAGTAAESAPPGERVVFTQGVQFSDRAGQERLRGAGMQRARSFLRMLIEMNEPPPEPVWPSSVRVRTFLSGEDDVSAVEAMRAVFRDHWGYVETPLEDDLAEWRHWIYEDEDFDTDLWFLAEQDGSIIGFCQCYPVAGEDPDRGLVDELGVLRGHRGRGIATALLLHAFRAFHRRGKRSVELGVDAENLTGATKLYEKVGMRTIGRTDVYELELRPGDDPVVRVLKTR